MSDVLSQSEIDALLAAMAAGDIIDEDSSKNSDNVKDVPATVLENSSKFKEEDLHMLENVHREYTEIIYSNMFKDLNIKVSFESIQEIHYEEFRRSIPCPAVINIFTLNPLKGYLLFETSPSLVIKLADIFFSGERINKLGEAEFSEKDKDISIEITKKFLWYLEKAWSKVLKVKLEIESVEVEPNKIKLFKGDESVALVSFSIGVDELNTFFNICIPYSSIEEYLGKLQLGGRIYHSELNSDFANANLNIKVLLDNIQLSLGEIMNLQKGTLINTHKRYKNKVRVLIEEKHCFNGEIGLINTRKAVKIVDCLDKDV